MMHQKPNRLVYWVIWIALFQMLFIYQFVLGGGIPEGTNNGSPGIGFQALCIGVIAAATLIRWYFIPRTSQATTLLILMIIGLALGESAQLIQIFLIGSDFPETQMTLFVLSVIAVAQYAPVYAPKEES